MYLSDKEISLEIYLYTWDSIIDEIPPMHLMLYWLEFPKLFTERLSKVSSMLVTPPLLSTFKVISNFGSEYRYFKSNLFRWNIQIGDYYKLSFTRGFDSVNVDFINIKVIKLITCDRNFIIIDGGIYIIYRYFCSASIFLNILISLDRQQWMT